MNTQTSKKSFLKRVLDFFESLYLVLVGDLRVSKYNEMDEHLSFIKIMIMQDARWLCILPEVKTVVERHEAMVKDNWKSVSFEEISTFREKLKRTIEAERIFSPTKNNQG